jgi:D-glycero-D-manno-heptose 1,7-bisphosphate phosphatase
MLGFGLVLVTNQSGLARGYFDEQRLADIHARLESLLADGGVSLDGVYVCPHLPDDLCVCRKPRPGLVSLATAQLGFDARESIVIGDKACDIDLGRAVGATSLLVRTGYGLESEREAGRRADYVVNDLCGVAEVAALLRAPHQLAA